MKVLITGHKGFIGSHLLKHHYEQGDDITTVDIAEKHYLTRQDARDFFRENDSKFDLVWHMAGVIGGRKGIEGQPLSVAVDLSIDAEYFNWIMKTRPKHAVYMSSSAAYPTALQGRNVCVRKKLSESDIDLGHVDNPDYTYGWSKLTGEYLAQFVEGTRMHIFRPFSGYGGDQALDYPFPSFIDRAKRKADPFDIWGDGEQVRDFIHVNDLVNCMLEAIKQDVEGPVNIGWGRPTSFNQLAQIVTEQAGYSPEFHHIINNPVGVDYRVCDNNKMLSFYTPKISIEEGVHMALRGY
jgi:nucleoside-diphosphate-sugar epimerase